MTDIHIRKPFGAGLSASLLGPVLVGVAILGAYAPTIRGLINGPWQTEQEGHGPLIIAATLWLIWQSRDRLKRVEIAPAPITGWAILIVGLVFLYLSRLQQGLLTVEMGSILPVIIGSVLICAGWPMLRRLAFPIGFLVFAVPMPDWLVDSMTVPLKVFISDMVTKVLYAAGVSP
ncbi:archaeosortase/exosortase family protein [Bradyrhizobium sp. USDA 4459]